MIGWLLAAAFALPSVPAEAIAVPAPLEVMAVPQELRTMLRTRVLEAGHTPSQRLQLLMTLMSSNEAGLGMNYRDDATHTVAQGFASRQANCLTYTLMFLALAREAGLQAHPQEIDETLAWQQLDGIVYRSNHVNAAIRIGMNRYVVDVGSSFVIGRRPAHEISEQRLLAQYYNNRAAVLLAKGDLSLALAHAEKAISLDAKYPTTWSNTGVIRLRNGDLRGAEQAYLQALALEPMHAGALFNLAGLYQRSGDPVREAPLRQRLKKQQARDPFHQFMLGLEHERKGDAKQAVAYYRRAISMHRDEHRFHYRLARAYAMANDPRRAGDALRSALALCKQEPLCTQYRDALRLHQAQQVKSF